VEDTSIVSLAVRARTGRVLGLAAVVVASVGFLVACGSGNSVERDVRGTVRDFDQALTNGDYRRACSLLDTAGKGVLRRATSAVGARGTCDARMQALARLVGPRQLGELASARIYTIQHAGTDRRFAAQPSLSKMVVVSSCAKMGCEYGTSPDR